MSEWRHGHQKRHPTTLLARVRRAISGPERRELVALPESQHEVENDCDRPPEAQHDSSRCSSDGDKLQAASAQPIQRDSPRSSRICRSRNLGSLGACLRPGESAKNDGLLQVREIRDLRLNADLVTLSACDTGVGPVGEEGVENIVNAFIEAGAQSVVSTLWELEDHATAELMANFYAHLGRHEGKAEALRQAQLAMLKSGAPPYYWAGFELDGEPSSILFGRRDTNTATRSIR